MEFKKIIKNNIKLYIVLGIIILLGTIGITLALTTSTFNPIAVNMSTSTINAEITYNEGSNSSIINTTNGEILPISDSIIEEEGESIDNPRVIKAQFNVAGTSTNPENTIYDVALYANNKNGIDCTLRTEEVKWKLYKNGEVISNGNLSPSFDTMDNGRLVLTNIQQDLTNTPDKYTFILWISESCTGDITTCNSDQDQSKYLNKTFNASLKVELATKSKKTLNRVTSDELSCDYTSIEIPVCNGLIYNNTNQILINSSNYYTIENNTGNKAGTYTAILNLDEGYKWADGTTGEKRIYCDIGKKEVIITTSPQNISYGTNISTNLNNISVEGLIEGHTLKNVLISQSSINTDDKKIIASNAVIVDSENNDVTNNYIVTYKNTGTLTINCQNSSTLPDTINYTYTGESFTGIVGGEYIDIEGIPTATEIGTYEVIVTPKNNYCWTDGTTESKTLEWSILDDVVTVSLDNTVTENNGTNTLYYRNNKYYTNNTYSQVMTTISNPIITPVKAGYTFDGYYTEENGNGTLMITKDGYATEELLKTDPSAISTYSLRRSGIILYANWKTKTYTITYNANGGTGAPSSQTKTHGESITLSTEEPIRDEYEFLGWSTDKGATSATYYLNDIFTTNANTTLYAIWRLITAVEDIKQLYVNNQPHIITHYGKDEEGNTIEVAQYYYSYINEDKTYGLMNDGLGATITDNESLIDGTQGNIRYFGVNPNNYIYFNCDDYNNQTSDTCEKWRIIGIFDDKLKIIRDESIGKYSRNFTTTTDTNNTLGDWHNATLMTLLNDAYYYNKDNIEYYNKSTTATIVNFSTDNIGIKNKETRNLISENIWYLGKIESKYSLTFNADLFTNEVYIMERDTPEYYYEKPWTGKVALMNYSDYGYSIDLTLCPTFIDHHSDCTESNWLNVKDAAQWIINPIDHWNAVMIRYNGYTQQFSNSLSAYINHVRPTVYLKPETAFNALGDGSSENPYQIIVENTTE